MGRTHVQPRAKAPSRDAASRAQPLGRCCVVSRDSSKSPPTRAVGFKGLWLRWSKAAARARASCRQPSFTHGHDGVAARGSLGPATGEERDNGVGGTQPASAGKLGLTRRRAPRTAARQSTAGLLVRPRGAALLSVVVVVVVTRHDIGSRVSSASSASSTSTRAWARPCGPVPLAWSASSSSPPSSSTAARGATRGRVVVVVRHRAPCACCCCCCCCCRWERGKRVRSVAAAAAHRGGRGNSPR